MKLLSLLQANLLIGPKIINSIDEDDDADDDDDGDYDDRSTGKLEAKGSTLGGRLQVAVAIAQIV